MRGFAPRRPCGAPAALRAAARAARSERASSEQRASNERGTGSDVPRAALAGRSVGGRTEVGRQTRGPRRSVGRRSGVGRPSRPPPSCAPIGIDRAGRSLRARPHRRGGSLLGARVGPAAAGAGVGRAFATPRRQGRRSAPKPCARRPAAVRAGGSATLLRRVRRRGPFGASLTARHRARLVSGRSARAPAAGAPCSGLGATHSPLAASGGYGTAPPPPQPRQFRRTAPSSDPPRRCGRARRERPARSPPMDRASAALSRLAVAMRWLVVRARVG